MAVNFDATYRIYVTADSPKVYAGPGSSYPQALVKRSASGSEYGKIQEYAFLSDKVGEPEYCVGRTSDGWWLIRYDAGIGGGQYIQRIAWLKPGSARSNDSIPTLRFSSIAARVDRDTSAFDDPNQAWGGYSIFQIPGGTRVTVLARFTNSSGVKMVYVETNTIRYTQKGGRTETLNKPYRTFIPESSITY